MKCILLDDYQNVGLTIGPWSRLADKRVDTTALTEHFTGSELISRIEDAEILVIMRERTPMTRELLEKLPKLKLIVTSGMRNAAIDLAATQSLGVRVCGTGGHSEPPTELTWALILGLARNLFTEAANVRAGGKWQQTVGSDLYGKNLGLIGLGKIGQKMATIAQAFGMKVSAWSPNLTSDRAAAANVEFMSKQELISSSDFLSLHLVLSESTREILKREDLVLMKPSSYLINTSRAGLVETAALVEILRAKKIAGAGLDVFDEEPMAANDPLRSLPNVLCTPHLGYVTMRNYNDYFVEAVEDIEAFLNGKILREIK